MDSLSSSPNKYKLLKLTAAIMGSRYCVHQIMLQRVFTIAEVDCIYMYIEQ